MPPRKSKSKEIVIDDDLPDDLATIVQILSANTYIEQANSTTAAANFLARSSMNNINDIEKRFFKDSDNPDTPRFLEALCDEYNDFPQQQSRENKCLNDITVLFAIASTFEDYFKEREKKKRQREMEDLESVNWERDGVAPAWSHFFAKSASRR